MFVVDLLVAIGAECWVLWKECSGRWTVEFYAIEKRWRSAQQRECVVNGQVTNE